MIFEDRHKEALVLLVWEARERPGDPDYDLVGDWAMEMLNRGEMEDEEVDRMMDRFWRDRL